MQIYSVEDPKLAIVLYRDVFDPDFDIPSKLEACLTDSKDDYLKWREALVGYNEVMPDYRDCVDFKIGPYYWDNIPEGFEDIKAVYEETDAALKECLADYEKRYNFKMEFMESINFVRYNVGQHFQVHADSGFSYSCTVSSIAYLNDGYEGGDLWFPYLDITYTPKKGDILFFPSAYTHSHASSAITSGTKYSAVTMFDYNDNNHQYAKTATPQTAPKENKELNITPLN